MKKDTECILAAINSMDKKFSSRMDELEQSIAKTRRRQNVQSERLNKVESTQDKQKSDLEEIKKILVELASSDDSVIRRNGDRVYINKDKAYRSFENAGRAKFSVMKELAENQLIDVSMTPPSIKRTIVIWDKDSHKAVRTISVIMPKIR